MPSRASRNVCRICLMVSSLFAGIRCSSWMITRPLMPELLTRRETPNALTGVAGDWSEPRPASVRNGGRLQIGTLAGFASEYPAGFSRNPQFGGTDRECCRESSWRRLPHNVGPPGRTREDRLALLRVEAETVEQG